MTTPESGAVAVPPAAPHDHKENAVSNPQDVAVTADGARTGLFKDRNFRWLISGALLSALGDQFTLIALPWLVLQTTQDSLKLGLTLALIGIPRAVLMLFGGALIDRYSPKAVIQLSKYFNAGLLSVFALAVYLGYTAFPFIALFAFLLGISTAFSIPAGPAMMPTVIAPQRLATANASMMFIRNLTMVAGPLLASLLLLLTEHTRPQSNLNLTGLSLAFLFDGLSYAISIWTLEQVRFLVRHVNPKQSRAVSSGAKLWHELLDGLKLCWSQPQLRHFFMYIAAIALFTMGPLQVAMPLFAQQLSQSASVLGLLAGSHGAGTLLGIVATGVLPRLRFGNLGKTILLIDGMVAVCFIPMAVVKYAWLLALLLFIVGNLSGYLQVAVYTWIQRQVPGEFLGRTMSMFMFIFMGVAPLSAGLSGALLHHLSLSQLIVGAGLGLLCAVALASWKSSLRHLNEHSAP